MSKIRKTAPNLQIRADDNRGVLALIAELLFEQSCGQLCSALQVIERMNNRQNPAQPPHFYT